MNFLAHPIYSAMILGAGAYLSFANARGLSFVHTINPVNWSSSNRGSTGFGHSSFSHSHSSGHMSHK